MRSWLQNVAMSLNWRHVFDQICEILGLLHLVCVVTWRLNVFFISVRSKTHVIFLIWVVIFEFFECTARTEIEGFPVRVQLIGLVHNLCLPFHNHLLVHLLNLLSLLLNICVDTQRVQIVTLGEILLIFRFSM